MGDLAESEQHEIEALRLVEKAYGPEHIFVARRLMYMTTLYRRRNDYMRAERCCGRGVRIFVKTIGPDAAETGRALSLLSEVRAEASR